MAERVPPAPSFLFVNLIVYPTLGVFTGLNLLLAGATRWYAPHLPRVFLAQPSGCLPSRCSRSGWCWASGELSQPVSCYIWSQAT